MKLITIFVLIASVMEAMIMVLTLYMLITTKKLLLLFNQNLIQVGMGLLLEVKLTIF